MNQAPEDTENKHPPVDSMSIYQLGNRRESVIRK